MLPPTSFHLFLLPPPPSRASSPAAAAFIRDSAAVGPAIHPVRWQLGGQTKSSFGWMRVPADRKCEGSALPPAAHPAPPPYNHRPPVTQPASRGAPGPGLGRARAGLQPRCLGHGEGGPATGAPPAGEWRTAGGRRYLEEREGRTWPPPQIPEGGLCDCCLGASCTEAGTSAAGERKMVANAPPAGRLRDEALGPRV